MQTQQIVNVKSKLKGDASATQLFEQRLTNWLPKWLPLADLDVAGRFYPPAVPHSQGEALRRLAFENEQALAPCGEAEATSLLTHLRVTTRLNNDSDFEKKAGFQSLVKAIAPYPVDLVRYACAQFTARPTGVGGSNWFPRSAGELLTYIIPAYNRRKYRSWRLRELARLSDDAVDEEAQRRSWEQPIPLGEVDEMNLTMRQIGSRTRWSPQTGSKYELQEGDVDPAPDPQENN